MPEFQAYATYIVFGLVIMAITFNWLDMTLAAMLGLCVLTVAGVIVQKDILKTVAASQGPLALLFGGMVVARVLVPTGIFDHLGTRFLILTRGSGKRFLLLLVALIAVVCAILPNATAVILVAPVIIRVCRELDVDFLGPMVLTAIVSNAAGLLTLVGDPATFFVGQAMGISFVGYLEKVSLGGVLAIVTVVGLMPLLFSRAWNARCALAAGLRPTTIRRPYFCIFALTTLAVMVGLFLVGDSLPNPILPPSAAIIGASLALLTIHSAKVEPIENVIRDIDWKTILFIFCMMCYVEQLTKTGILGGMARTMFATFGDNLLLGALILLVTIGLTSAFLANIPVVAAAVLLTKGYLVLLHLVPEEALGPSFTDWPAPCLPLFVAMMFGGTLGGNATLIGAAANLVSAGICAAHGRMVTFKTFLRYGAPVTACQLAVSALYIWLLSLWTSP